MVPVRCCLSVRRQDVTPGLRQWARLSLKIGTQFNGFARVASEHAQRDPPSARDIIAVRDRLTNLPVGFDRGYSLYLGIRRQFFQDRALEIDHESNAAVVVARVTAASARLADPGERRLRVGILLPENAVLVIERVIRLR